MDSYLYFTISFNPHTIRNYKKKIRNVHRIMWFNIHTLKSLNIFLNWILFL